MRDVSLIGDTNYEAAMMAAIGIVVAVYAIILLISAITDWNLFERAGEKGWKAIIPFYNMYISNELFFGYGWYCIAPIGLILISAIPYGNIVGSLGMIAYRIAYCMHKAEAFGKSGGYAALLFFFDPFTSIHLVLSGAEYCGEVEYE